LKAAGLATDSLIVLPLLLKIPLVLLPTAKTIRRMLKRADVAK
jgi:hypothetical protein